jgi:hypothetical protein
MVEKKNEEIDQMAEDVKKAVGKEKEELVAKTIAETRERLAKEKELADMKEKMEAIEKAREEEAKKYADQLEALKGEFKAETEKIVKEFQDSRKSAVNTNNPFNKDNQNSNNSEPSMMERYKTDEEYRKQVDEESKRVFHDYLDKRSR